MKRFDIKCGTVMLLLLLVGCEGVQIQTDQPARSTPGCQDCPESVPCTPQGQPGRACPACPELRKDVAPSFRVTDVRHSPGFHSLVSRSLPYCDIPSEWRERNYAGGSCVHASLETVLHWQGQHEMAAWWRATYAYGEYPDRMHGRLDQAGLRFAYTQSKQADGVTFLQQCCELRLCAAVNLPRGHMQTLVGLDQQYAYVIDNNGAGEIDRWPRDKFLRDWTGWAVTIVGQAPPPEPFL